MRWWKKDLQTSLIEQFFSKVEHTWIKHDRYIHRSFIQMFELLNEKEVTELVRNRKLVCLPANGKWALSFDGDENSHIVIFPDLYQSLRALDNRWGLAVLLHELGHLILNHANRQIDRLEAQVEADHFAATKGLALPLQEVLLKTPSSIETQSRVALLTSYLAANGEFDGQARI